MVYAHYYSIKELIYYPHEVKGTASVEGIWRIFVRNKNSEHSLVNYKLHFYCKIAIYNQELY